MWLRIVQAICSWKQFWRDGCSTLMFLSIWYCFEDSAKWGSPFYVLKGDNLFILFLLLLICAVLMHIECVLIWCEDFNNLSTCLCLSIVCCWFLLYEHKHNKRPAICSMGRFHHILIWKRLRLNLCHFRSLRDAVGTLLNTPYHVSMLAQIYCVVIYRSVNGFSKLKRLMQDLSYVRHICFVTMVCNWFG